MARPASRYPTDRELEILKLLWETGPANVRQVRDALSRSGRRNLAYTSVMTVMTTMVEKGYLKRRKHGQGYAYTAQVQRSTTTGRMLHDLIHRAFDGASANVAIGLLKDSDLDSSHLQELRTLINQRSGKT